MEIQIGGYVIRAWPDGTFWIENKDGEGARVSAELLEEKIAAIFKEIF